ncbi:interferon-induced transmembrane protein 1-like [Lissotriton helveticus]
MDNGNFQMPAGTYPYTTSPYEPLKEEMEVGILPHRQGSSVNSTVVNVTTYHNPPRDHLIWSVFNTIYMNFCCLGCMALVFSVKARDRKVVGDMNGAQSYGSTAKCLNIAALVLTLLLFILIIVLIATGVIALTQMVRQLMDQGNPNLFYGHGK